MEYKSYTTVHPKSVEQQEKESKIAANVENQVRGKQLYIGGLTWVSFIENIILVRIILNSNRTGTLELQ